LKSHFTESQKERGKIARKLISALEAEEYTKRVADYFRTLMERDSAAKSDNSQENNDHHDG